MANRIATALLVLTALLLGACSSTGSGQLPSATVQQSLTSDPDNYEYLIGAGDSLNVFVWDNPDISGTVSVRPDGKITTALAEDIPAAGMTPSQLARAIEKQLETYIKDPKVTVTVVAFQGPFSEQIRVIGEASNPRAVNYRHRMTLLDVMIEVGGLTTFAAGNRAQLVRVIDGAQQSFSIRLDDLIRDGDINANVDVLPGDVIIIPEAWF